MSTLKVGGIRGVSASSDAITVANDGTCTANITSNGGSQFFNRNKIINGEAQISQRGTISNHGTSPLYTAVDRFSTRIGTSFNFDVTTSQSTDTPDGFQNSLKVTPDSTQTPSGSANGGIQTKLEGQDLQNFQYGLSSAKPITLSFYAKSGSAGAGTYSIEVRYKNSSNASFNQTRAFTITSSWQRFTFTIEANGAATSNDIRNDNNEGFVIIWHLASGPSDQTSAVTTWTSSNAMTTITGMDNFMSSTSNEFFLTGVQLEVGSIATDFEHRSFGEEEEKCLRYYQNLGISKIFGGFSDGNTTSRLSLNFMFIKPMRIEPTKSFTNDTTGSSISDRTTRYAVGMVFNTTNSRGGTGHITDIVLDSEL